MILNLRKEFQTSSDSKITWTEAILKISSKLNPWLTPWTYRQHSSFILVLYWQNIHKLKWWSQEWDKQIVVAVWWHHFTVNARDELLKELNYGVDTLMSLWVLSKLTSSGLENISLKKTMENTWSPRHSLPIYQMVIFLPLHGQQEGSSAHLGDGCKATSIGTLWCLALLVFSSLLLHGIGVWLL